MLLYYIEIILLGIFMNIVIGLLYLFMFDFLACVSLLQKCIRDCSLCPGVFDPQRPSKRGKAIPKKKGIRL